MSPSNREVTSVFMIGKGTGGHTHVQDMLSGALLWVKAPVCFSRSGWISRQVCVALFLGIVFAACATGILLRRIV